MVPPLHGNATALVRRRVSKATADEFCEHFDFLFGVAAEMKAPIHPAYVGVGEVGSRIC